MSVEGQGENSKRRKMERLWSSNSRCQCSIAETVTVRADGQLCKWLFTSKQEQVVKKRVVEMEQVKRRFGKMFDAEEDRCVVYKANGEVELVGIEDLDAKNRLRDVMAIQGVVPTTMGQNYKDRGGVIMAGSVYTNCYCAGQTGEKKPSFVTTTQTAEFHKLPPREDGSVGYKRVLGPIIKCKVVALMEELNQMTLNLVRFLESTQGVPVAELTAQYMVDGTERPWLIWLEEPKLKSRQGRRRTRTQRSSAKTRMSPRASSPEDMSAMHVLANRASKFMEEMNEKGHGVVDTNGDIPKKRRTKRNSFEIVNPVVELQNIGVPQLENNGNGDEPPMIITDSGENDLTNQIKDVKTKRDGFYPNPFNCHGDFCDFVVRDPDELVQSGSGPKTVKEGISESLAIAKQLLTKDELDMISQKLGLRTMPMEESKDQEKLDLAFSSSMGLLDMTTSSGALQSHHDKAKRENFTLPMKSIAIARKEKRGFLQRMGKAPDQRKEKRYERGKRIGFMGMDAVEKLKAEHGGVSLGTYYQQVSLCENCYKVYTTLDRARDIMQQEAQQDLIEHRKGRSRNVQTDPIRDDLLARLSTKKRRPESRNAVTRTPSPNPSARRYMQEVPKIVPSLSTTMLTDEERKEMKRSAELKKVEASSENIAKAIVKASDGATCTREDTEKLKEEHPHMKTFNDLDGYLRGTRPKKYGMSGTDDDDDDEHKDAEDKNNQTKKKTKNIPRKGAVPSSKSKKDDIGGYKGHILLVDEDQDVRNVVMKMLMDHEYIVTDFEDATPALELCKENHFDLLLVSTDLGTVSGVEMTKIIRKQEKRDSATLRQLPIVAFTHNTSPEDLRLYMEVGMNGCVSKPVNETALLNTVRSAIPHHRPSKKDGSNRKGKNKNKQIAPMRPSTTGLVTSSDVAKLTLPMPSTNARSANSEEEATSVGVFQYDADTSFPYVVMGSKVQGSRLFNLVVVNDFFDTYETMQIFFRPILSKYPGLQILLFNLPGQAFTEWRKDAVLNNQYYAECLDGLMRHVDYNVTKEFETRGPYAVPFYLMGFGNGGNIATHYALRFKPPAMRSLVLLNGFTHVDPHLAGVLHDCMNVFSCSPATRPDLPVYFYTRFLFSSAYLTKVSTPLALNLYTAVHNPITLEGRMQICKGSLAHVDLRQDLNTYHQPIILVQAAQDGLVKPLHVETFVKIRGGEVHSIRHCLKERRRPCVIWLRSGHEVFQECRKSVSDLMEQLVTGYHENHDVKFLPTSEAMMDEDHKTEKRKRRGRRRDAQNAAGSCSSSSGPQKHFEDRFIDNVLGTLHQIREQHLAEPNPFVSNNNDRPESRESEMSANADDDHIAKLNESNDPSENPKAELARWSEYKATTNHDARALRQNRHEHQEKRNRNKKFNKLQLTGAQNEPLIVFDPTKRNFEFGQRRRKNDDSDEEDHNDPRFRKEGGKRKIMQPVDVPEVREYMQWRIARNRKQLSKLVHAANIIQRSWRSYLARTLTDKLRRKRAALFIQTRWRAKLARDRLDERKKEEWAARLVQRCWRGKAGRDQFLERRAQAAAARHMQRIFRGRKGKDRVSAMKSKRRNAAVKIQNLVRAHIARKLTWKVRQQRNAAIDIQRVFRGFKGRNRASLERDRYLFSKAQSQGIDFGRQMLLEHKLHGTRLQSEVSLLTREKVETEEKVEALLAEIAEFDKGVRALEREMHELTAVETAAKGMLDEEAKVELREQKMRLDREFGVMLGKIADRKERLRNLEIKLQTIDRTRQGKEEELRDLERKLVVLLEEQQNELEQIKKRQEARGDLMLPENAATLISKHSPGGGGPGAAGMVGYSGPTPQQQQQANNLMQSTESLMKFGFMSMSLTYFSSINMIRAMRKVGALNTVLNGPGGTQAGQEQIQALLGGGRIPGDNDPASLSDAMQFKAKHKPGEMKEAEERLAVAAWTVEDVGDWLETLKLGQYQTAFADAAIDGAFLYDLNNDDLRNTLGIDHNLHRKKILNSITRLRRMEEARDAQVLANSSLSQQSLVSIAAAGKPGVLGDMNGGSGGGGGGGGALLNSNSIIDGGNSMLDDDATGESKNNSTPANALSINPNQLVSMVRHGKLKDLRAAMEALPDRPFDENDVATPYIEGFGTQYRDELNRLTWHINKPDDHGNTLITIAAQNGKMKIAQFLLQKGANPNHQNNQGQTPLHYAIAYNFYDMGAWLADADAGAGANDAITNMYDLSPYDGLAPE